MTSFPTQDKSPSVQSGVSSVQVGESSIALRWQKELEALEALGFKAQPWKSLDSNESVVLPVIDVDWLIAQPMLPYLVQVLPTQVLYRSLQAHGIEDSLEVIETIRGEALVRFLDYELWTSREGASGFLTSEEDLSAERFLQWIRLWNEISPEFAAERLMELDEGVIVGCLTALCEIVPIGLNRTQEELSDDYWVTPDNKFGLRIKTQGESDFEVLHAFIHSIYNKDVRTAQQLLAHSAMMIREEAVEEARRWRQARLEDQGFVHADEARGLLTPKTHKQVCEFISITLKNRRSQAAQNHGDASGWTEGEAQDSVRSYIRTLDHEFLRAEIERTLSGDELLQLVGNTNIQTEMLLQDEEVLETFVDKVVRASNVLLMRLESHNAKALKLRSQSNELLIDRVLGTMAETDPAQAISWKARLARTTNGVSVALGVANDASELTRVLSAVRGCLNIGLENLIKNHQSYGIDPELIQADSGLPSADSEVSEVSLALALVLGPEALFQVGWQVLQELALEGLQNTIILLENTGTKLSNESDKYPIQLADGQVLSISVLQLLRSGRYLEVRKWLKRAASDLDESVQHVLLATVNRLPVFPIILREETGAIRGTTEVKPYEVMYEVESTRRFLSGLGSVARGMGQGE